MYEEGVITNNEELRNFATKLGIFAMLQSGVQVSPISYTKILPIELYSGVSNTVYNNFLNSAEDINPDLIWKQFHQNNAMNSVLVPLVKEYNIESSGLLKLSGLVSQSRRDYIKTSSRVSAEYNRLVAQHKATKSTLPLAEFVKQNTTPELYKTTLYERVRLFDAENNDITEKQNVVYYKPIPVVGNKMYMIEASTGDIVSKVKANAPLTDTPLITEAIEKVRNKVAAQVVEETDEESTVSEVEEGVVSLQPTMQPTQPSNVIEPKGTINIYWGQSESSTSTRILSNLAPRKFNYESVDGVSREYGSVEHAYQSNKNGKFDKATYDAYVNLKEVANKQGPGYGVKIAPKLTEVGKRGNLQIMKDLVVESFIQNPNSEAAKKLLQYENFTHNTNELIDKAFLEGLKLAQKTLLSVNPASEVDQVLARKQEESKKCNSK
jgi:hypothetical protein